MLSSTKPSRHVIQPKVRWDILFKNYLPPFTTSSPHSFNGFRTYQEILDTFNTSNPPYPPLPNPKNKGFYPFEGCTKLNLFFSIKKFNPPISYPLFSTLSYKNLRILTTHVNVAYNKSKALKMLRRVANPINIIGLVLAL